MRFLAILPRSTAFVSSKLPSFCLTHLLPIVRELVGFPDPVVYEVDREVMASGLGGGGGGDLGAGITTLPLPLKVFGLFFFLTNGTLTGRYIDYV